MKIRIPYHYENDYKIYLGSVVHQFVHGYCQRNAISDTAIIFKEHRIFRFIDRNLRGFRRGNGGIEQGIFRKSFGFKRQKSPLRAMGIFLERTFQTDDGRANISGLDLLRENIGSIR